ncbi:undecaprenyl-diphosphatase [Natronoarchaeum philippinense]|uniref:Undecaprenyl-diphosphatase n=1 Tax=Natronoarchaeum philippinense TaxID=558529 RepID=A0A285P0G5_NATPI|nr:undecaprenyl-diphosphate phosphatase [Natronoarchaeum philippinense]SNZ15222.1 undecaprenyl-diphosphatase [Natronoarchaeum philippinense]
MDLPELLVAFLAGVLQGILEWLPVSSQGNLSLFLTAVGTAPEIAVQLSLFLQVGTTVSAALYYRSDIAAALADAPKWRPRSAFERPTAELSFVVLATAMTGLVGVPLYATVLDAASELAGGAFVALIGALLVLTGLFQQTSESVGLGERDLPNWLDAVIVGALQGLAVLPGVSRSGTTASGLLVRGHDGASAFRLSFLMSIPAGLGAAALTMADAGGLPGVSPDSAVVALLASVVVGYAAIDALLRIVERVPFWAVCYGLGGLAILGGALATVV